MKRLLVLVTTGFPFAAGEPYLESEVPVLAEHFSRVLIFAIGLGPDQIQALPLPQNAEAFNCAAMPPKKERMLDLLHGVKTVFKLPCSLPDADKKEAGASIARRAFLGYFLARIKRHTDEIKRVLETMALSGYDEAVVYGYWLFAAAGIAAALRDTLCRLGVQSVRTVSRAHGYDLYAYANRLNYLPCRTMLLDSLDAVCPCSQNGTAYLQKSYPAFAEKIRPAFLGTDGGVLSAGSADGVFRILTCARTIPLKRLDRLADVLRRMQPYAPIEWTHIGDGSELSALRQKAAQFPPGITAQFLGAVPHDEVLRYYRTHPADVFVLVSTREGLPVSVMEALSFGVPAIVTDVGGCTELIRDGENGLVLPKEFSDEQLLNALGTIKENGGQMRAAAFSAWQKKFVARENYERFVRTVLQDNKQ